MPIYDCRCRRCGEVSEVFLRSPDAEPAKCASCGSGEMERLVSVFSVLGSRPTRDTTCCGRDHPCDVPPCSAEGTCPR